MQRVILHAVFMLLAKPTRADAEHHEPGAYFAGSLPGDLTAKLDLPDEWTLDKEAEVDTAARYVMQRVCRGASFKSGAILDLYADLSGPQTSRQSALLTAFRAARGTGCALLRRRAFRPSPDGPAT